MSSSLLQRLAAALTLLFFAGCSGNEDLPPRIADTAFLLGTAITVTIQQHDIPRQVIQDVFDRTEEIQNLMSANERNYESTEILTINRAAGEQAVTVSPETLLVVQESLEFARLTGGAFDPSVHPLIVLWGMGTEQASVPPADLLEGVVAQIGWEDIQLDREQGTVFLPREGMSIDVGGIAKGYAADEGARILREAGVQRAILDFGGDIVTIGGRVDGTPWRIGIQHPSGDRNRYLGILNSRDESVVSSGDYERYFVQDGVRYHHIFDPETGFPSTSGLNSVTVIGPQAIRTDALSTAFFVMGLEASLAVLAEMPDYEGIFATEEMQLIITAGLADRFERPDEAYTLIVR